MNKKLPLRFSILKLLVSAPDGLDPDRLFQMLKDTYPNEKQCRPDTIDGHLMSMKGVGLVDVKDAVQDGDGKLVSTYVITEYGSGRLTKYVS